MITYKCDICSNHNTQAFQTDAPSRKGVVCIDCVVQFQTCECGVSMVCWDNDEDQCTICLEEGVDIEVVS
jgi:hypothetical protein